MGGHVTMRFAERDADEAEHLVVINIARVGAAADASFVPIIQNPSEFGFGAGAADDDASAGAAAQAGQTDADNTAG